MAALKRFARFACSTWSPGQIQNIARKRNAQSVHVVGHDTTSSLNPPGMNNKRAISHALQLVNAMCMPDIRGYLVQRGPTWANVANVGSFTCLLIAFHDKAATA
eukprot:352861-Chlamydomonas_euryale.AAC.14